jgi:DNA-binding Lrp family transcriptional regulator
MTPPDFIQIPYQLLIDDTLQPSDRLLYGFIYWFHRMKNEKCTASNTTFAELLKVEAGSVTNALNRLEERGYIQRVYKDKTNRVRLEIKALVAFAHLPHVPSDNVTVPSDNGTHVPSDNGQKKNSLKKEKNEYTHASLSYLSNIPPEDIQEFTTRFQASPSQVRSKAEDLKLYCERKGRSYRNYKSFLLNALKRDFKERGAAENCPNCHKPTTAFTDGVCPACFRSRSQPALNRLADMKSQAFNKT